MDQEFDQLQRQMAELQRQAAPAHETPQEQQARNEVFGGPPPVIATFYVDAEKDYAHSAIDCPVYAEGVYVYLKITEPGGDAISQPATSEHLTRFPKEYEAFKRNLEARPIPLDALPKMRPAIRRAFKDLGILSVDDVIAKELPERYAEYKQWATWIKAVHERAEGRKLRIVA